MLVLSRVALLFPVVVVTVELLGALVQLRVLLCIVLLVPVVGGTSAQLGAMVLRLMRLSQS